MGELDNNNGSFPEHTKQGGELMTYFWCEQNGVDIRPEYHCKDDIHEWGITITINGKCNKDPKVYDKKDIMEQIYKYSEYYFNKYCHNKDILNKKAKEITESAIKWRKTINNSKYG